MLIFYNRGLLMLLSIFKRKVIPIKIILIMLFSLFIAGCSSLNLFTSSSKMKKCQVGDPCYKKVKANMPKKMMPKNQMRSRQMITTMPRMHRGSESSMPMNNMMSMNRHLNNPMDNAERDMPMDVRPMPVNRLLQDDMMQNGMMGDMMYQEETIFSRIKPYIIPLFLLLSLLFVMFYLFRKYGKGKVAPKTKTSKVSTRNKNRF